MQPGNEPLHLPSGEFISYPSDGQRPYEFFEIYRDDKNGHIAALITSIMLRDYLPSKLRWRKRRKYVDTYGAAALEQTAHQHFPDARYIGSENGAMLEFSLTLPAGVPPVPIEVEQRLLTETRASTCYEQLHTPDSPFNRELRHRLHQVSIGTEWQKYFQDLPG